MELKNAKELDEVSHTHVITASPKRMRAEQNMIRDIMIVTTPFLHASRFFAHHRHTSPSTYGWRRGNGEGKGWARWSNAKFFYLDFSFSF
jgi:hypothetical protein